MANPELTFQSSLIEAARELGGQGMKISHRFLVGVPDLMLQLPRWPTVLAEVKLIRLPIGNMGQIKVALTGPQEQWLSRWQAAGTNVGVIIAHRTREADLILSTRVTHAHLMPTKQEFLDQCLTRKRGQRMANFLPSLLHRLVG